jgi:uncharacterized protein YbaR (Trm112 family)
MSERATDTAVPGETHPRLLEILVCPLTKGPLTYDPKTHELVSPKARLAYPIRNGVPLLTAEAARPLDDVEKAPQTREE